MSSLSYSNMMRSLCLIITLVAPMFLVHVVDAQCNPCAECGEFDGSALLPEGGTCADEVDIDSFASLDPDGIECGLLAAFCISPCCTEFSFPSGDDNFFPNDDDDDTPTDDVFSQECSSESEDYFKCLFENIFTCSETCSINGDDDTLDDDFVCDDIDFMSFCSDADDCCPPCYGLYKEMIKCGSQVKGCNENCDGITGTGSGGGTDTGGDGTSGGDSTGDEGGTDTGGDGTTDDGDTGNEEGGTDTGGDGTSGGGDGTTDGDTGDEGETDTGGDDTSGGGGDDGGDGGDDGTSGGGDEGGDDEPTSGSVGFTDGLFLLVSSLVIATSSMIMG